MNERIFMNMNREINSLKYEVATLNKHIKKLVDIFSQLIEEKGGKE